MLEACISQRVQDNPLVTIKDEQDDCFHLAAVAWPLYNSERSNKDIHNYFLWAAVCYKI